MASPRRSSPRTPVSSRLPLESKVALSPWSAIQPAEIESSVRSSTGGAIEFDLRANEDAATGVEPEICAQTKGVTWEEDITFDGMRQDLNGSRLSRQRCALLQRGGARSSAVESLGGTGF